MLGGIGNFSQPFPIKQPAGGITGQAGINTVSQPEVQQTPPQSQGIDVKPLNDIRNQQTNPASDPEKSKGVTQIQSNISQQVTGNSAPYNRLKLASGREIDIEYDPSMFKGSNMTPEQMEEAKKKGFEGNKENYLKALNGIEGNLPKDAKTINITQPYNPMFQSKPSEENAISYDPDKKTLNMPFNRLEQKPEDVAKELGDVTNPELLAQKKKLSDFGIKWVDPNNTLTGKEELELMKTLENTANKVPPENRPKDLTVAMIQADIPKPAGFGQMSGGGAEGSYTYASHHVELYRDTPYEGDRIPLDRMKSNLVHEYGHAISDTNKADASGHFIRNSVTDTKGNSLFARAETLEAGAKAQGHKPDDTNVDDNGPKATLYDKFDPFVQSHGLRDNGKIVVEKYARMNKDEHFAETFEEYVDNPERFKGKISNMQSELGKLKEGTPEYNYQKESLDIMQSSYDYFKTQVFGGYEFGKK